MNFARRDLIESGYVAVFSDIVYIRYLNICAYVCKQQDMSSHRQMGTDQAKKLIEEAKNLDSRFSKSYARK